MSGVEGSSVPPPGWKEGQTGATYMSAIAPVVGAAPGSGALASGAVASAPVASGAVASGAVASGAPASGAVASGAPALAPIAYAPASAPVGAGASPVLALAQPLVASEQPAAEAAVRWRMRAATLDNLLVYAAYLALCLMLGWKPLTVGHLLVELVLGVVYHFALESHGGQTIGKRRYGIQVVSVNGGPATPRGIALRSLLRFIDALPFSYLSGLISMVRTGPERRQRIGDVAGETKVIAVDGRAAARGTPGWLLPTATLVALVISCLGVYGIAEAGRQPLSGAQQAEFISGCDNSGAGVAVDCRCLLNRLEADGYSSVASIQALETEARNEQFEGQSGPARNELTSDVFACHI